MLFSRVLILYNHLVVDPLDTVIEVAVAAVVVDAVVVATAQFSVKFALKLVIQLTCAIIVSIQIMCLSSNNTIRIISLISGLILSLK